MGEKFRRQENRIVDRKIALFNVRRAMVAGALVSLLVPLLMIFGSSVSEIHGGFSTVLVLFETVCLAVTGANYLAVRRNNLNLGIPAYRIFWASFEITGFYLSYISRADSVGVGFYPILMVVFAVVPLLSFSEFIYGFVAELIFVFVVSAKYGTSGFEIFNILVLNGFVFWKSREAYAHMREYIAMKENSSEKTSRSLSDIPTGLMNGKGFERAAYNVFMSGIKNENYVAVLITDIDNLKSINGRYGAKMGDECIRCVSGIIKSQTSRYTNAIARLEGGKFAVCMECGCTDDAVRAAEKIRSMVSSKRMVPLGNGDSDFMTVSVGVAAFVPEAEKEYYIMYEEAEDSLIEAKENGKNLTIFEDSICGNGYRKAN